MPHSPSPGDTPKRKHFPRLRPEQPPANPDICSFARPSLCGFRACFFLPSPRLSKIDHFTGGTGRQTPSIPPPPHLYPETHKFARGADCQRSCFTDWSGRWGVCGGWGDDKDDSLCGGTLSAAATRNLFRKNRILYTMVVGVKKGGTY